MQDIRSRLQQTTLCRLCGSPTREWTTGTVSVSRGSAAAGRNGRRRSRRYERCPTCDHIQCAAQDLPDHQDERERYEEHQNDLSDPRYREYLQRFIEAGIVPFVPVGAAILDYGSGPTPALTELLTRRGYRAVPYDPFFSPRTTASDTQYQAVVALEVVEHFHSPGEELSRIVAALAKGGVLSVRTGVYDGTGEFLSWWYRRDVTHVSFWTERTIEWIAGRWNLHLIHRETGEILVFSQSRY